MIVSKENTISKVISQSIDEDQYFIDETNNIDDAIYVFQNESFDIVIYDGDKIEDLGKAFIKELKSFDHNLKTVCITNRETETINKDNIGVDCVVSRSELSNISQKLEPLHN